MLPTVRGELSCVTADACEFTTCSASTMDDCLMLTFSANHMNHLLHVCRRKGGMHNAAYSLKELNTLQCCYRMHAGNAQAQLVRHARQSCTSSTYSTSSCTTLHEQHIRLHEHTCRGTYCACATSSAGPSCTCSFADNHLFGLCVRRRSTEPTPMHEPSNTHKY